MKLYREEVRPSWIWSSIARPLWCSTGESPPHPGACGLLPETVQRSASSLHAFTLAGATATPLENSLALHQIAIAEEEAESVRGSS